MDRQTATQHLASFLEENLDLKPDEMYKISQPSEMNIKGDIFYSFHWVEAENGQSARGGWNYYVFSDGRVLYGGSANPDLAQELYHLWKTAAPSQERRLKIAKFDAERSYDFSDAWAQIIDKVLVYLKAGNIVFVSMEFDEDQRDLDRKKDVPIGFRTDGEWMWSMELEYYLEKYSLPIDPRLLAHIRSNNFTCPQVEGDIVNQAWEQLQLYMPKDVTDLV